MYLGSAKNKGTDQPAHRGQIKSISTEIMRFQEGTYLYETKINIICMGNASTLQGISLLPLQ